jgi:ADP-ribose pyrophosphatase YjhB (NUDIX family)
MAGAAASWLRIAWWGLVAPAAIERAPLVVVQAVVLGPHGLLLSLRDDLWGWELPGGTPIRGESLENALLREVREETGLDVVIERRVGRYRRTGFRPHTAEVFVARTAPDPHPQPGAEVHATAWWPCDGLPRGLLPWYRQPIADALASGPPVERVERSGLAWIARAARVDLIQRWRGVPPNAGSDESHR